MVGINFTQSEWVVISLLCSAIVFLAFYIVRLHKISRQEQKENLISMTTAMLNNTKAVEGSTTVMNEVKNLMYTVNNRIIEMNAKNGNKNY